MVCNYGTEGVDRGLFQDTILAFGWRDK